MLLKRTLHSSFTKAHSKLIAGLKIRPFFQFLNDSPFAISKDKSALQKYLTNNDKSFSQKLGFMMTCDQLVNMEVDNLPDQSIENLDALPYIQVLRDPLVQDHLVAEFGTNAKAMSPQDLLNFWNLCFHFLKKEQLLQISQQLHKFVENGFYGEFADIAADLFLSMYMKPEFRGENSLEITAEEIESFYSKIEGSVSMETKLNFLNSYLIFENSLEMNSFVLQMIHQILDSETMVDSKNFNFLVYKILNHILVKYTCSINFKMEEDLDLGFLTKIRELPALDIPDIDLLPKIANLEIKPLNEPEPSPENESENEMSREDVHSFNTEMEFAMPILLNDYMMEIVKKNELCQNAIAKYYYQFLAPRLPQEYFTYTNYKMSLLLTPENHKIADMALQRTIIGFEDLKAVEATVFQRSFNMDSQVTKKYQVFLEQSDKTFAKQFDLESSIQQLQNMDSLNLSVLHLLCSISGSGFLTTFEQFPLEAEEREEIVNLRECYLMSLEFSLEWVTESISKMMQHVENMQDQVSDLEESDSEDFAKAHKPEAQEATEESGDQEKKIEVELLKIYNISRLVTNTFSDALETLGKGEKSLLERINVIRQVFGRGEAMFNEFSQTKKEDLLNEQF